MSFNYFIEKKKFEEKWKKLEIHYANAGMSQEAIQSMYVFDLEVFNSNRKEERHKSNVPMNEDDEFFDLSILLSLCPRAIISNDYDALSTHSRFWWIDEITHPILQAGLKKLTDEQKELLTLHIVEEYSTREIARLWGASQSKITRSIRRIFKEIKNSENFSKT